MNEIAGESKWPSKRQYSIVLKKVGNTILRVLQTKNFEIFSQKFQDIQMKNFPKDHGLNN